jgi:simple sugar transport system permease protein
MNNKPSFSLPFEIHIAKRDGIPAWKRWMIRSVAILVALLLCAVITILITKLNPLTVLKSMIKGTFGSSRKVWKTCFYVVILLGISLAVTPAFKMRFWNIGAEGQVLIGAFAAAACMFYMGRMSFFNDPNVSMGTKNLILFPCMFVAAIAAGALWGFLPAFFKSRWNTNETLFTLMMNYVAMQIVRFMISYRDFPKLYQWSSNGTAVGTINKGFASEGIGTFSKILDKAGTQYLFPIACIGILTLVLFTYLKYSKHGYEISVVGESERTASYAGIKVDRVIIRTMVLSGLLCGFVGFLIVGAEGTVSHDVVDGRGYTAVMVSWMSQFNPFGMIFSSLLLVFMQFGAKEVAMPDGVSLDKNFANMLMSIILFFIIGCEFFINYELQFSRHTKKEE